MKFRSDNKKINQYMLHAIEIEVFNGGRLIEFKRGLDAGYAVIADNKVIELFVRNKYNFNNFKNDRSIDEIIEELNE